MTSITFQGDAVVMHGDKVGTGPECCCQEGCVCPELCEGITFEAEASIGGMTVSVSTTVPGAGSQRVNKNDGSGDYIEIGATVACGELGPDSECGWDFNVGVCYQSGGVLNGETHQAFQAKDADGCPDVGEVDLQCLGFCSAIVTGEIQ